MGLATILLNDAKSFEQIANTPSTESPMWILVITGQALSGKTFQNYKILYMYTAQ